MLLLHMCRGPKSRSYMVLGWWSNLWEPPRVQISWHCWLSCWVPILAGSLKPELHLVFGCGSLYLFVQLLGEASQSTIVLCSSTQASQRPAAIQNNQSCEAIRYYQPCLYPLKSSATWDKQLYLNPQRPITIKNFQACQYKEITRWL